MTLPVTRTLRSCRLLTDLISISLCLRIERPEDGGLANWWSSQSIQQHNTYWLSSPLYMGVICGTPKQLECSHSYLCALPPRPDPHQCALGWLPSAWECAVCRCQQLRQASSILEAASSSRRQQLRLKVMQLGWREGDLQGSRRELAQSGSTTGEQTACQETKEQFQACQCDRRRQRGPCQDRRCIGRPWSRGWVACRTP